MAWGGGFLGRLNVMEFSVEVVAVPYSGENITPLSAWCNRAHSSNVFGGSTGGFTAGSRWLCRDAAVLRWLGSGTEATAGLRGEQNSVLSVKNRAGAAVTC
ncbi:hypothetical protein CIPAW_16G080700 [Carya illinoinensis]|uniref:Uncharacterized protein n=1 Tax=Carya illinoinensis TaxID=32201 RepID=A0A8T1N7S9_CARIL|nr:hypothetical protein CIPAW_16G080700 [Carya illinoinensis]